MYVYIYIYRERERDRERERARLPTEVHPGHEEDALAACPLDESRLNNTNNNIPSFNHNNNNNTNSMNTNTSNCSSTREERFYTPLSPDNNFRDLLFSKSPSR